MLQFGNQIIKVVQEIQKKVKEIDSRDTDETESESSVNQTDTESSAESINRTAEFKPSRPKRQADQLTVRAIRVSQTRPTRQLQRTVNEFEFKITLNGREIVAILDTRSPISNLPTKYHSVVKPKRVIKRESSRKSFDEHQPKDIKFGRNSTARYKTSPDRWPKKTKLRSTVTDALRYFRLRQSRDYPEGLNAIEN